MTTSPSPHIANDIATAFLAVSMRRMYFLSLMTGTLREGRPQTRLF